MRILVQKFSFIFYASLILGAYQNCAPMHVPGSDQSSSSFENYSVQEMSEKFSTTLQPLLRTNCGACHGISQNPMFAVADSLAATQTILEYRLVNLDNPSGSRFVSQIMSGHQGFTPSLATEVQIAIQAWADALTGNTTLPSDRENPVISIVAPTNGANFIGSVEVAANATDNVGVAGVQFLLDGAPVDVEITTAPYTTILSGLSAGAHTISARARDASGNLATSTPINFTVTIPVVDVSPPLASITSPANGAMLTGTININVDASDNVGVSGVQLYVGNVTAGPEDVTPPYSISFNPAMYGEGAHVLTVRARDAAGNIGTSSSINVTYTAPDNMAPIVNITSPSAGTNISTLINVAATATDNMGVIGVRLYVDGVAFGNEDLTEPYSIPFDPSALAVGQHSLVIRARDAAGNTGNSPAINVMVSRADTTPPTISITAPANGSTVSGTVNVTSTATDNVAVAGVQLLVNNMAYGAEDITSPYAIALITTGLANGTYSIVARARDAAGNISNSAARTITVNNAVSDTTPPITSITFPTNNLSAQGTITISANATDNVGVIGVQLYVDGSSTGAEDTTSPYSISLNTLTLTNGLHALTIRARDAAGNITTSSAVNINVNNPDITLPQTSITSPASGSTLIGTVNVNATATDNIGVVGVRLYIDGIATGTEDTAAPYSISFNSTTVANGAHLLTVRARDAAGNTATSAAVNITINNPVADTTAPSVNITAPSAGAVTGTVTISANAADNVGVAGVTFLVNGVVTGAEDTTSPYSVSWNTSGLAAGNFTLTARARDAAGNITTSSPVVVSVSANNPNATYTWIAQNILGPRCLSCHGSNRPSAGYGYDTYTNTMRSVRAGNLNASLLYTETNSGSMPASGSRLTAVQMQAISDWIMAGALNN